MGEAFLRHHEAGAELNAGGAHQAQVADHVALGDAAGDEDGQAFGVFEEDLLEQHDGRHVSDVAAGLAALEDQASVP